MATGLEEVSFHPNPEEGQDKESSNYHTVVLISLKLAFSSALTKKFQIYKLDLEKTEEPEIILPAFVGSQRKLGSCRQTSTSASLTTLKPLTVWITENWRILQEMGIPDHLTCLLRNLYAGQEATVRTGHGMMFWFQIGTGVHQGCILLPCLLNFYAEYIV